MTDAQQPTVALRCAVRRWLLRGALAGGTLGLGVLLSVAGASEARADGGALDGLLEPVTTVVETVTEPLAATVTTVIEPVAPVVQDVVAPVAPVVQDVVEPVAPVVQDVVEPVAPVVQDVVAPVAPIVQTVVEPVAPILDAATPLVDAVRPTLEPATELLAPLLGAVAPLVTIPVVVDEVLPPIGVGPLPSAAAPGAEPGHQLDLAVAAPGQVPSRAVAGSEQGAPAAPSRFVTGTPAGAVTVTPGAVVASDGPERAPIPAPAPDGAVPPTSGTATTRPAGGTDSTLQAATLLTRPAASWTARAAEARVDHPSTFFDVPTSPG